MVFDSYTRDTNSDDARRPVRESKFTADWTANSRVVDSDYESKGVIADRRVVDMDEYKYHNASGIIEPGYEQYGRSRIGSKKQVSSSSSSSDSSSSSSSEGSPVAIRRQSPPRGGVHNISETTTGTTGGSSAIGNIDQYFNRK